MANLSGISCIPEMYCRGRSMNPLRRMHPLLRVMPKLEERACTPFQPFIGRMGPGYTGTRRTGDLVDKGDFPSLPLEGTLGSGRYFNTSLAAGQFIFALLLSKHELVARMLKTPHLPGWFSPNELRDAQVLSGLKILDLGCGEIPSFARACRRFGADVYTIDVIPHSMFDFSPDVFSGADRELERTRHIQLYLDLENAPAEILSRTGGQFDLVTEAFLDIGWKWEGMGEISFTHGQSIAPALLIEGGFYFYSLGNESECFQKE